MESQANLPGHGQIACIYEVNAAPTKYKSVRVIGRFVYLFIPISHQLLSLTTRIGSKTMIRKKAS